MSDIHDLTSFYTEIMRNLSEREEQIKEIIRILNRVVSNLGVPAEMAVQLKTVIQTKQMIKYTFTKHLQMYPVYQMLKERAACELMNNIKDKENGE